MLIIKEFDIEYIEDFMKLEISKSQEKFVYFDLDEIVKSSEEGTNVYPYVIYHDLLAIGLAYFKEFDKDMYLLKYMIDYKHQGKGYGKDSSLMLIEMIKPSLMKEELYLSVLPRNTVAIGLYEGLRFTKVETEYDVDDEVFFKYKYN